ncbi:hypothetical protein THOM_2819 [Trachipleistophora hominis]|uniref:Ricin B lectin domain-containing protein n=1 Tax=Trachipleistophora hominis TaxID=72359 RepID=L7JU30_TRAHO|nr:hypothetical protein THOM_2819 [Trachipleistophora hominis]
MRILLISEFLFALGGSVTYMAWEEDPSKVIANSHGYMKLMDKTKLTMNNVHNVRLFRENDSYVLRFGRSRLCYDNTKQRVKACRRQKMRSTWELVKTGLSYLVRQNEKCIAPTNTIESTSQQSELTLKDCDGPDVLKIQFNNSEGEILDVPTSKVGVTREVEPSGMRVLTLRKRSSINPVREVTTAGDVVVEHKPKEIIKNIKVVPKVAEPDVQVVEKQKVVHHGIPAVEKVVMPTVEDKELVLKNQEPKKLVIKEKPVAKTKEIVVEQEPSSMKRVTVDSEPDVTLVKPAQTTEVVNVPGVVETDHDTAVIKTKSPIKMIRPANTHETTSRRESAFQKEDEQFMRGTRDFQESIDDSLDKLVHSKSKKTTLVHHTHAEKCEYDKLTGAYRCR